MTLVVDASVATKWCIKVIVDSYRAGAGRLG